LKTGRLEPGDAEGVLEVLVEHVKQAWKNGISKRSNFSRCSE
jgi:hypothetical protein